MSPPSSAHAAYALIAEPETIDLTRLRRHFAQCLQALGPLHRVRCAIEALDAFLAPRFVTTLFVLAAALTAGSWLPV